MTNPALTVRTLTDGGQPAAEVAGWIAAFIDEARTTLDLAQYDFHLQGGAREIVAGAIERAAARGVRMRFAYNVDHRNPIPVPPPPEPDVQLIATLPVDGKAVAGVPDLMHHKYVVRDGTSVWTGSMNWTDDSFTRQENVVVTVDTPAVAAAFTQDFEQLWSRDEVEDTGLVEPTWHDGVRAWFTPGYGEDLSHRIAKAIGHARRRVRICSPVITTAPVLGTLAQVISEGRLDVAGCVDRTQIGGVVYQWRQNGNVSWKLPLLERVMAGPFTGKISTAWRPEGSLHD
ncbi:MAG TPA: phospholipase D-like domain-containing protein, partial [Gaiellaceae bacterium]|nr:phospholipase D-like domain-containing protein [Gaiellaceae bacterium]